MKKITSLKLAVAVMAIACFTIVLKSCKKVDNNTANPKDASAALAAAQKAIIAQYGNVSGGVVIPVNKSADEYFYKDATGKMASLYAINKGGDINRPTPCIADCNNTTNPADLYINYNLDQAERFYLCESNGDKSNIIIKWTVNLPFVPWPLISDIYLANTFCNIKFTSTSGTVVNYTATFTGANNNFTIKALGQTSCPYNSLYEVSCKVNNIPNAYFGSTWLLSSQLSLDVNCPLVGNVSASSFVNAPAFSQNGYLPCNRIDKVYITTPQQGSGAPTVVTGNYAAICNHPSGFNYIDKHQLEYRKVTSSTSLKWEDQGNTSTVYGNVPLGQATQSLTLEALGSMITSAGYLTNMTNGSGKWLVRYRNIQTSGGCGIVYGTGFGVGGVSQGNGNWGNPSLWLTEVVIL
jgi:hypothetical protein